MARFVGFSILIHCSVHSNLNIVLLEYILISSSINNPIFNYLLGLFSPLFLAIFFPDEL